jgi:hypothetical protein
LGLAFLASASSRVLAAESEVAAKAAPPAAVEPAQTPEARPTPAQRALATAAAVVPGAVVHGAGHHVAGDPSTGYALLAAEGVGLGMVAGGGSVLIFSGASRYLVGPATIVTMLGVGLFGFSMFADVYGVATADGGAAERVPRVNAVFESELGYRYVSDPLFAYDHFVVEKLSFRSGRLRLTPSAWFATGGESARYRVEGAYRFLGVLPGERGTTSDHLDLVIGGIHQRYGPNQFDRTGAEVQLDARYDLSHIGATLHGAFVDASVGYALARITYDLRGTDVPGDTDTVLLGGIGFGAILRGKAAPGSELRVYYDHRHDELVGGLVMPGLGSGVLGRFGVEGRWFFSPRVGFLAEAQAGSALMGGVSLVLRDGIGTNREKR